MLFTEIIAVFLAVLTVSAIPRFGLNHWDNATTHQVDAPGAGAHHLHTSRANITVPNWEVIKDQVAAALPQMLMETFWVSETGNGTQNMTAAEMSAMQRKVFAVLPQLIEAAKTAWINETAPANLSQNSTTSQGSDLQGKMFDAMLATMQQTMANWDEDFQDIGVTEDSEGEGDDDDDEESQSSEA